MTDHREIFVDNNATTRPLNAVQDAMLFAMNDGFGNPSSSHRGGVAARRVLTQARDQVASLVRASSEQVLFTSGATEANNWVFHSIHQATDIRRILTTDVEHSSVNEQVLKHRETNNIAIQLAVSREGLVDLDELSKLCSFKPTFVSIHWVNNETGVVQDIEAISEICHEQNAILHVDGSQAVGKLPVDFANSKIDFLTFAAHKFHGPQGVGAVCCRKRSLLSPLMFGGGQESGLRPGTENLPGIAGFGKAAEMRMINFSAVTNKMLQLRDSFERLVFERIPDVYINGAIARRVCNTSNLRFDGVEGQALVAQLDAAGIRCSQSSACTAQIPEPSYVLRAMGLTEAEAYSSIRFSFSELNTFEEIEKIVDAVTKGVTALRDYRARLASDCVTELSK